MERKFKNSIENSPIAFAYGLITFDERDCVEDFSVLYVNKYFEKTTGLRKELILNRNFSDFFERQGKKRIAWMKRIFSDALKSEYLEETIYSHTLKSWFQIKIEYDTSFPNHFKCWITDITAEKILLKTSEEILNSKNITYQTIINRALKIGNAKYAFLASLNMEKDTFTILSNASKTNRAIQPIFHRHHPAGTTWGLGKAFGEDLRHNVNIMTDPMLFFTDDSQNSFMNDLKPLIKPEETLLIKIGKKGKIMAFLALFPDENFRQADRNILKTYAKQLSVIFHNKENELREKKRIEQLNMYESIISTVSDPMSVIDCDYRYLIINNAYTRFHNRPREAIIGRSISEFYKHNNDFEEIIKPRLDECLRGKTVKYKHWLENQNGEKNFFEICYYPRYSNSGEIIGCVIQGKDLTEEISLRKKLSNVIEGTDAGTWERDLLTGEAFLNERWANMLGYTLKELFPLNNMTWKSRIHPDDLEKVNKALAEHYRRRIDHFECEFRMRHKNGSWIWILSKGKVLEWTDAGKPLKMFGTQVDISKRKEAEEKLIESRNLMHSIVDTLPGDMTVIDDEYRIIAFNKDNFKFSVVGITDKNATLGKKCYEVYMKRDSPCPWCRISDAMTYKKSFTEITSKEDPREKISGKSLKLFVSPIFETDGTVLGAVEYALDITDLKEAKETAEKVKKQKEDFFANMSHDLRTPVNSIIGYSKLLQKTLFESTQKKYINHIINTSDNLLQIIKNILEYSKAETGKLCLNREKTDIYKLLNTAFELIKPLLNEKTSFTLYIDKKIPRYLKTDDRKLEHIMNNLLSNAVKFTEEGRITLSAKLLNRTDTKAEIKISVKDTGIGIEEKAQQTITGSFDQGNSSIPYKYGGTGLGLSVVSKFLELFDSELTIESMPGKGSKFSFILNSDYITAKEAEKDIREYSTVKDRSFKVLIAEDNEINIMLLEAMIKRDFQNAKVLIAKNGEEAVELYKEHEPGIVFMDINMPLLSGYDATQKIRKTAGASKISIIGFTASSIPEVLEKAIKSGMNECITKPVTAEKIKLIISNCL